MSKERRDKMDLRRFDRRHLVFYLRVFDGMSSKIFGHLVDISEKGVLLMTNEPVERNEDHRLRIRLPPIIRDRDEVVLNATSRWCKKEVEADLYLSGFQVSDADARTRKVVLRLMTELGYTDSP